MVYIVFDGETIGPNGFETEEEKLARKDKHLAKIDNWHEKTRRPSPYDKVKTQVLSLIIGFPAIG